MKIRELLTGICEDMNPFAAGFNRPSSIEQLPPPKPLGSGGMGTSGSGGSSSLGGVPNVSGWYNPQQNKIPTPPPTPISSSTPGTPSNTNTPPISSSTPGTSNTIKNQGI